VPRFISSHLSSSTRRSSSATSGGSPHLFAAVQGAATSSTIPTSTLTSTPLGISYLSSTALISSLFISSPSRLQPAACVCAHRIIPIFPRVYGRPPTRSIHAPALAPNALVPSPDRPPDHPVGVSSFPRPSPRLLLHQHAQEVADLTPDSRLGDQLLAIDLHARGALTPCSRHIPFSFNWLHSQSPLKETPDPCHCSASYCSPTSPPLTWTQYPTSDNLLSTCILAFHPVLLCECLTDFCFDLDHSH
jgi:hypothetical protein